MPGSNVALKVDGANVVDIGPGGLPVYGALVQPTVLSYGLEGHILVNTTVCVNIYLLWC